MTMSSAQTLDWRGMMCPAPIINTAKAARKLKGNPGVFRILADDPAFALDIQSWCRSAQAELIEIEEGDGHLQAIVAVNKGESPGPRSRTKAPSLPPARTREPIKAMETHDFRGMLCPAPIINTAKSYRKLSPGDEIALLADDPAFRLDIESWCRSSKARLVTLEEEGNATRAVIQKPGPARASEPAAQPARPTSAISRSSQTVIQIDLSGLSSEQRGLKLAALDRLGMSDTRAEIVSRDAEFTQDVVGWCGRGHHALVQLDTTTEPMRALVDLNPESVSLHAAPERDHLPVLASNAKPNASTLLILHNDFEALLAALMVANAAAAGGRDVVIFFSFWGVNLLRGDKPRSDVPAEKISFFQRVFKWMMPKGPKKQQLGQLNFGGLGTGILNGIMKKQNIMTLNEQLQAAIDHGVRFTVCTMSMGVMGITKRDLADFPNLEYGGVASFVDDAQGSGLSLVF